MANAALTYVFDENVNLALWINYYGNLFGRENLFVIDRSSTDGSTIDIGPVNVFRIPRTPFNDFDKTLAMNCLHSTLLTAYDAVVVTDCDEFLVPDPDVHPNLNSFIDAMDGYATGIGMNVSHILDQEEPLDLNRPILSQREFMLFNGAMCKTLVSRTRQDWSAGMHALKLPPKFDKSLFIFHLKTMDYNLAVRRQRINQDTTWYKGSIEKGHGTHHRQPLTKFVFDAFLTPMTRVANGEIGEWEFHDLVVKMMEHTVINSDGFHCVPMHMNRMMRLPKRFATCF